MVGNMGCQRIFQVLAGKEWWSARAVFLCPRTRGYVNVPCLVVRKLSLTECEFRDAFLQEECP